MKFALIATGFFFLFVTLSAVTLLVRTGSLASKIMVSGVAMFWIGVALLIFGPRAQVTDGQYPRGPTSEVSIQGVIVTETPSLPVGYIMLAGLMLLAAGYLVHALRE